MIRTLHTVNRFLKRHYVPRTLIGTILAFCLLAILQYPARSIYYGTMSGQWFLNVRSATVTYTDAKGKQSTNIPQNKAGVFTLARQPRTRVTAYNVVRTFYLQATNNAVLQRNLPDGIEYEQNIKHDYIPLRVDQRPNEIGYYYFCQIVSFKVDGFEKHSTFCTTPYRIVQAAD